MCEDNTLACLSFCFVQAIYFILLDSAILKYMSQENENRCGGNNIDVKSNASDILHTFFII